MIKLISRILANRFDKVDTGFAVSARCIFVHKNNLGHHSFGRSGAGNASELGFPELKDSSTFPRLS
jgi:hypothetical protein